MAFTRDFGESVACPFFMPDQRLAGDWPFPQRLPLGAGWSGTCTASQPELRPAEHELKTSCNIGYASTCARLPKEREADAVRFALGEERDGLLRIRFAYERECLPAGHGELVYETAAHRWHTLHSNACLLRMAECYIETQMARRASARSEASVDECG